jgi:short-subunit dehydrogenase
MIARHTLPVTDASKGIGGALSIKLATASQHVVGIARGADDRDFPGTLVPLGHADRDPQ